MLKPLVLRVSRRLRCRSVKFSRSTKLVLMEVLAAEGQFQAPRLETIERACDAAHADGPSRGRIFVDLWDLERFAHCAHCFDARRTRLHAMNLTQTILPPVRCSHCRAGL